MARPTNPPVTIRPARKHEAEVLTAIALASKAHWGYDAAFMEMCRLEMSVSPEDIEQQTVVVAQVGRETAGFYGLEPDGAGGGEVHKLFVGPKFIGHGIGRRQFEDLCLRASGEGMQALYLDSDPHALGFYERMGCAVIGEIPSGSIPGRMLPRMQRPLGMVSGAGA